jgi:hypothetical protein
MKSRMKMILIFILGVSLQARAQSDEDLLKNYRQAARDLVRQAMNNGYKSIDGVPLAQVAADIETSKLDFFKNSYAVQGSREGAVYEREEGLSRIRLNKEVLEQTPPELIPAWSLHEHLGASAYEDRDYSMSLQIQQAAKGKSAPAPLTEKILRDRSGNDLQNRYKSSGSGTSVAGGGDPQAIGAKMRLLEALNGLRGPANPYGEAKLSKMAQIALDCSLELVDGKYAVAPEILTHRAVMSPRVGYFYPPGTAWARLAVDRRWFLQSPANTTMPLLLEGLSRLADQPLKLCDHHSNIWGAAGCNEVSSCSQTR